MKKLKATTLVELIVVLLLSSLLLVSAYMLWHQVEQQYRQYAQQNAGELLLLQFQYSLRIQFEEADQIKLASLHPPRILFQCDSSQVIYQFDQHVLSREVPSLKVETFPFHTWQVSLTGTENKTVQPGEAVEELTLQGEYNGLPLSFSFKRPRQALSAFQTDINHESN